jgi:hypothetical protein
MIIFLNRLVRHKSMPLIRTRVVKNR